MAKHWRILYSGEQDAGTNMALDAVLLQGCAEGWSPPTLRIYGWTKPTISIGYHQSFEKELDFSQIPPSEIDLVRRPTGGRAVLHIEERAYAVIAPETQEPWCINQETSYRQISLGLIAALNSLKLFPHFHRGEAKTGRFGGTMQPCFASTSKFEVVFGKKKLVGSAQRRIKNAFLQHGSILCSPRHLEVVHYLKAGPAEKERFLKILQENSICIEEYTGKKIPLSSFESPFLEHFAQGLQVEAEIGILNSNETEKLHEHLSAVE
jgi:lipoyl(octanoyl) transferase